MWVTHHWEHHLTWWLFHPSTSSHYGIFQRFCGSKSLRSFAKHFFRSSHGKQLSQKKGFKKFKYTFVDPTSSTLNQMDVPSIMSKKPKLEAHPPSNLLSNLIFVFQFCDVALGKGPSSLRKHMFWILLQSQPSHICFYIS